MHRLRKRLAVVGIGLVLIASAACAAGSDGGDAGAENGGAEATKLRIGYFPNVTHAPAIVGVEQGIFEEYLGDDVELETRTFNAGGQAIEALFGDAIDLTYVGPNPALNGFVQSDGEALRIIAGSTSGGAFLVVRPEIDSPEDLRGKKLSSPMPRGNTQDVALRAWLTDQDFETDLEGGGDVSVQSQENAQIFESFRAGQIDGGWVPEPWATRMIEEAGGHVLVDERDLWTQTDGKYVTVHVAVSTRFLEANPDLVRRFLEGHVAAIDAIKEDPDGAQSSVLDAIEEITGARLDEETVDKSFENLEFTADPIAASLRESADDAVKVGLLEPVEDLADMYDLEIINEVLADLDREEVEGL